MNRTVITAGDSDTLLAHIAEWVALDQTTKEFHISRACVHVQMDWTCANVVWEDDPDTDEVEAVDIPDEIKEAVAYYAYADYKENLFGNVATPDQFKGNLRSVKNKVGSITNEESYYRGGVVTPKRNLRSLSFPDMLMKKHCERVYGVTTKVTRV